MKILALIFSFLITTSVYAQDITGQWNGVLNVQGMQLRVVFHVQKTDAGLVTTMDSPDQQAKGIPTQATTFENSVLKIIAPKIGLEYEGKLASDQTIQGNFKQGGQTFAMVLSRNSTPALVRPQNRDEELFAHKPFLVLL
ncbi:hypothetical protein [Pedobacter insulae]|uniref:Alpha/beta hydrolase n=1 Tax=Pedobacter insulae TaxID=414048 RepID=A0A1I2SUM0_9SPHI|nr:hypothetical protein [Pedobacter insulae]SFG56442.1 hypothetical protein SAMN04489864_10165 [Pedobacter insulae]